MLLNKKTRIARFGFTLVELLFWLALVGFIIVGYILKNYKTWQANNQKTSADKLLKSNKFIDRTQGDQKLKQELIQDTP